MADFTRERVLTFPVLFTLMLTKGLKSLQLRLNEYLSAALTSTSSGASGIAPVTAMAYCKARMKLKHTAFIELNKRAVVDVMYGDDDYATFKGFRLLGQDGSLVQLPDEDEVKEQFGTRPFRNTQHDVSGEHCFALASVCWDVLNRVAVDARLLPVKTHETTAAVDQLDALCQADILSAADLVIEDRGYDCYRMMAAIRRTGAHFLIRCKRHSGMKVADEMLAGNGPDEQIVTIPMPEHLANREEYQGLPTSLSVRFVRVVLDNGTVEVLATSVLDDQQLTADDLRELYWLRWGIETFYGLLKTRLNLENFSGYSVEAIRQDFFATIFLCGVESIFTMDAEETLAKKKAGHPKKVNKAVSFNAIKSHAFELFYSNKPIDQIMRKLDALFLMNPTLVRKDREIPRAVHPDGKVLSWYKRKRKGVF